ncbi:MAG: flippase-like domain-containing protein [Bacteroidales bacterium]|nr:flippase-like domain-containing protein [Bacteroidales bacterium]
MKITVKGTVKFVLMLALACVLLYYAFSGISWTDFVEGLRSCNWLWISAAMITGFLAILFRGLRWRLMLLPVAPKLKRKACYDAYSVCYLSNLAVPRSGELVRCGMLASDGSVSFENAFGSMILERSWDLVINIVAALCVVLFTRFRPFIIEKMWTPFCDNLSFNIVWLLVAVVVMVGIAVWAIFAFKDRIKASKTGQKLFRFAHGFFNGFKAGFKMKHNGTFIVYTLAILICYWFESMFVILAFPAVSHLGLMDALLITVIGSVGWLVPVQGGFGAYHFLVSVAMVPLYGISQSEGIVFATISHETQVLMMIICGTLSLISVALAKKKAVAPSMTEQQPASQE